MDRPLFPTSLVIDLNDLDIEKMCYYSEQWGIDRKQLERGVFSGDINAVHTPHIQLATTTHSLASTVEGDFPAGSVLLFFVQSDAPNIFQNSQMTALELIYAKESKEIDLITNSKSKILTFVVEETLFNQIFYDYFARPAEELLKDQRLFIEPDKLSFFLSGLYAWSDYLKSEEHRLSLVKDYDKIELEMITHVFACLVLENRTKERVKFNVSSARDLLHESIDKNIILDNWHKI